MADALAASLGDSSDFDLAWHTKMRDFQIMETSEFYTLKD